MVNLDKLYKIWQLQVSNNPQWCREGEKEKGREMSGICGEVLIFSSVLATPHENEVLMMMTKNSTCHLAVSKNSLLRHGRIKCKLPESGIEQNPTKKEASLRSKSRMEEYNMAMKRMMRNPYEYHHDLGMNYTLINDNLIVGSQPQKAEDIDHLKNEENVAYILNLQQDEDIEYWGIDLKSMVRRCKELGVRHMRMPAVDFDPDSLRNILPKAVSSLEWAISEGKGRVYVHCTAGLGRAPAVAIAYMFWFCGMDLNTAYETLTSRRPCGPNKRSIQAATYDLAKNDPWKEPFESLAGYAFEDVADWERNLIQDFVRSLRGT